MNLRCRQEGKTLELYQLEQFMAAAELSHISKAAQKLSISQPALSKNIHALEKELGYPLFDHVGKNIRLNKNGEIFLKYVREVFAALENARAELRDYNDGSNCSISLSVQAASRLLPDILRSFTALHPGTRFSVSQFPAATGVPDCDFTIQSSLLRSSDPDSCTLLKENILVALPAKHPLSSGTSVNLADLRDQPFISLQKGIGLSSITDYYCQQCGFVPNTVFESDSPSTIRNMIHLGLGIAFIPELTWPGIEDESIRLLSVRNIKCIRYINLLWNRHRYYPATVWAFKDFLVGYFAQL